MERKKLSVGLNVTTLITLFNDNQWKELFEYFGKQIFSEKIVHESSFYPEYIVENRLYDVNGVFYDYLIRKHKYNIKKEDGYDHRSENMKKWKYMSEKDHDNQINNQLELCLKDYETHYKNKNNHVLEILPNIYNTSSLHMFFFYKILHEFNENMLNLKNINDTINYITSIKNIEKSILNPICGCKYFNGDADLIIDDSIIYDIKVSKYEKNDIKTFSQLILYSIGFYVNEKWSPLGFEQSEKKTIKNFKIYNPLLGKEYHLYLPNLNFDKIVDFLEINT
jgi:hypothetical protein